VVDDLSSVYCLVAMAGAGEECTSLTYMVDDLSTYDASGGMDTYISELFSFFEDTGYTPVEQNTSDTVYTVGDKEVHARTLVHAVLDDDQVFYSRVHLTYLWWMLDESHVLVCYAEETSMLEEELPDWKRYAEQLSFYMRSTGKEYQNHAATILSWANRDREEEKTKESWKNKDYSFKEGESL